MLDFPSSKRLNLRLPEPALARIREAAELRRQDVSSFVLAAALDRASEIVEREQRTRLHTALLANGLAALASGLGAAPDDDDARFLPDPDDPDTDLWADNRVTRERDVFLKRLVFDGLKARRAEARERGEEFPAEPSCIAWY